MDKVLSFFRTEKSHVSDKNVVDSINTTATAVPASVNTCQCNPFNPIKSWLAGINSAQLPRDFTNTNVELRRRNSLPLNSFQARNFCM